MIAKRVQRVALVTLAVVAAAIVVASIGPGGLPTPRSMVLRAYVGQFLAWPFEHLVERPYRLRDADPHPVARPRLEQRVREAGADLQWIHPDPAQPDRWPPVAVLHLRGTPYEMGYVYGRVLRDAVRANVTRHMMPEARKVAWPRQLNDAWKAVEPFVPEAYLEELRGLADGSGVKLELLQQMHAVPEISEQMCSGYALDEKITAEGIDYHVRILDYATGFQVQRYPVVLFYEPLDDEGRPVGNAYLNVTWAGFDWSVGGVNERGLAIGEISGGSADDIAGERADGEPMGVLMRRALNQADDVGGAELLIEQARRNMRYVYVLSDRDTSSKILSGPTYFRVIRPGEALEKLGEGYDALPGYPDMVWHGANHETHIERFESRHVGLGFDDLLEHNRAVAQRQNLHTWILGRGGCDGASCDRFELWLFNAVGKYDRAVDQPFVHLDLVEQFDKLR